MAADPWGVCVVPAVGDPGGLLGYGPCGSRSPAVITYPSRGDGAWQPYHGVLPSPAGIVGLPLRWGEALVPEGWDRARRVLHSHAPSWPRTLEMLPDMETLRFVAWALTVAGLASRVVLLDLVDGRVVERAP